MERHKKGLLFFVSVILLLFIFYTNDFGLKRPLDHVLVSANEYQELTENRTQTELDYSFKLKIDDVIIPFDEETRTFLLSVDEMNLNAEQNPEIDIVMEQNLIYDIALLEQEITPEFIEQNKTLKLLVFSDDKYDEFDIHVTTLPVISLSLNFMKTQEEPIGVKNRKASMILNEHGRLVESDLNIRIRGGSSRAYPKKQYRINLREFTIGGDETLNHLALLGMREDDDWILYPSYNDPEKMRNTFSNNFWHDTVATENRFNINTGTEGRYVELFINNSYWGLYTLMHPIDAKQLDLNLEKTVAKSDLYYRSISNVEIIEEDFKQSSGQEMAVGRFELREPDKPFGTPEQWEPLMEHMSKQKSDLATLENYLFERTDVENQIHYYLYSILLQATDNNYKNHNYISKFADGKRVMLESPWDLDLTWGLRWNENLLLLSEVSGDPTVNPLPSASLIHTAVVGKSERIISLVKERYGLLRADKWSDEAIFELLNQHQQAVYGSGAILREHRRWPDAAYNEETEQLYDYIRQRLQMMDHFIESSF